MKKWLQDNLILLAWVQAWVATLGSLFFSEVMHWKPCTLCWYQRILMYPLVMILMMGLIRKDKQVSYYILPLSLLGLMVALYHNLLQWRVLPESLANCVVGVPCVSQYRGWFGFVTIPLLSLTAFWVISALMVRQMRLARG